MNEIRYFLNGVQFFDEPIGLSNIVLKIIREDGFTNSEQILREKTDTKLRFNGDAYAYICQIRKENLCADISLDIEIKCSNGWIKLFNGLIKLSSVEFSLQTCIANTSIKDATFVGQIDNFIDTDVQTYLSRTRNCETNVLPEIILEVYTNSTTIIADQKDVTAYDALDLIQYLVNYFTDNSIEVKSDFLSGNDADFLGIKQAVTLGYNLNGTGLSLDETYLVTSINEVFEELRKKFRLYMEVETLPDGTQCLRIEREDYFFEDTELMRFDNIPFDAVEKFDIKRLFNSLKVGSTTTELQGGNVPTYPQSDLTAWNEEKYGSCGGCSVDKDSENVELDLVSDWIIDSNLIYEVLNGSEAHNDSVFLIAYEIVGGTFPRAIRTFDADSGTYIYNADIRNNEVIDNWLGYTPNCIALSRQAKYGFKTFTPESITVSADAYGSGILFTSDRNNIVRYSDPPDIIYDNENSIQNFNNPPDAFTYFTAQENGSHAFRASGIFKQIPSGVPAADTDVIGADLEISLEVYDVLNGTLIDSETVTQNNAPNLNANEVNMQIEASFNLAVGNIVVVKYRMIYSEVGAKQWLVSSLNNIFQLIDDDFACEDISNDTSSRPYILEFTEKLCLSDYLRIKANKKGYILINNCKYWIKEIEFSLFGKSKFKLVGDCTKCGC